MNKEKIGLLGLAVMGQNLALNIAGYNLEDPTDGWPVVVWNRTTSTKDTYLEKIVNEPGAQNIRGANTIEELVKEVGPKGVYWLMVKVTDQERDAVDDIIDQLLPHLEPGAVIIDGGNTHFTKTIRREKELAPRGIGYVGTGVSGGEEGALKGPAYMPGCEKIIWNRIEPLFKMTAAKAEQDGEPCVHLCGPNGAGHYVKMVHNAIEYGDMALIGESVWVLNKLLGWNMGRIGKELGKWNSKDDVLKSYLIEITADGLQQPDKEPGVYLTERIADITRMKGTGLWACRDANEDDILVLVPTWYSALQSRLMSMLKDLRLEMSEKIKILNMVDSKGLDEVVIATRIHNALYGGKIASYAQGATLLQKASKVRNWDLNMYNISRDWRGGCIIRAQFLDDIAKAYEKEAPTNLLVAPFFQEAIAKCLPDMLYVSAMASQAGIPIPVLDSAKNYILQLASPVLVSASVQAGQRDYFGAHGYLRIDEHGKLLVDEHGKPREFHTEWMQKDRPEIERQLTH